MHVRMRIVQSQWRKLLKIMPTQPFLGCAVLDIIAFDNFISRDIVYHSSCTIAYWRKYVQGPQRCSSCSEDNADDAAVIAAEIEFFDDVLDQIDLGEMSPQFRPKPCTKI